MSPSNETLRGESSGIARSGGERAVPEQDPFRLLCCSDVGEQLKRQAAGTAEQNLNASLTSMANEQARAGKDATSNPNEERAGSDEETDKSDEGLDAGTSKDATYGMEKANDEEKATNETGSAGQVMHQRHCTCEACPIARFERVEQRSDLDARMRERISSMSQLVNYLLREIDALEQETARVDDRKAQMGDRPTKDDLCVEERIQTELPIRLHNDGYDYHVDISRSRAELKVCQEAFLPIFIDGGDLSQGGV